MHPRRGGQGLQIAGREFGPADRESGEPVVIIDEALARQHFGDRSPLGQLLTLTPWRDRPMRIVGVAPSLPYGGLRQEPDLLLRILIDAPHLFGLRPGRHTLAGERAPPGWPAGRHR